MRPAQFLSPHFVHDQVGFEKTAAGNQLLGDQTLHALLALSMVCVRLGRGAVILVELDPSVGREQRGVRPCIVVSDSNVIRDRRFPLLCVVPVTGTPGAKDSSVRY
jgi:hypothetical protein